MELSVTLQNKIINFLKSLPNIDDTKSRRAFIYSAGLDFQLKGQIPFDEPPAQFIPLLVSILLKYGRLKDGRNALEAVLEAAKNYVGQDRQANCETILQKLRANEKAFKFDHNAIQLQNTPEHSHDLETQQNKQQSRSSAKKMKSKLKESLVGKNDTKIDNVILDNVID